MSVTEFVTVDSAGTQRLAGLLAKHCEIGDCVLLRGDLGAGKTEFARGFILALQPGTQEITSPTFTLIQHYAGEKPIWHFDLYRLKNREELRETGLEDALQSGITLIEWPDLAKGWLPPTALTIDIGFGASASERKFAFADTKAWQARLAAVKKEFYNK